MKARTKIIPKQFLMLALAILWIPPPFAAAQSRDIQEKQKEKEKQVKITEEILIVAEAPKELPAATVVKLPAWKIEDLKAYELSEAIKYAPGIYVTSGDKNEYSLKIRGMDPRRIALLIDGVPVYEPYYSSFNLKTVATQGIHSIQITKGASSVLYGPNTMGGIVNVITRRPAAKPELSFQAGFGEKDTKNLAFNTSFSWKQLAFSGNALYQGSKAFYTPSENDGPRLLRSNSDYERLNLAAKIYYTPSAGTELMVDAGIYKSQYGMPAATFIQKARYWKFKNWDRYSLNAGGYMSLGGNSTLRFRAFMVNYQNTLDQYRDAAMTKRQFESTFDNTVAGLFVLGDISIDSNNSLKAGVNYQHDQARTQDDIGLPWTEFNQGTYSAGIEDHFSLARNWKLIGGLSLDYLDKFIGKNTSKVNPMIGLKFTPLDTLDLHLSFSAKSRFPSMRSMYSPSSGNPSLHSERGTNSEFGFTYNSGAILISGAVFMNSFKDMIDTYTIDGIKRYYNVAKARVNGFELQVQKTLGRFEGTANYTYLDHKNVSENRPLDALSMSTLTFDAHFIPMKGLRLSLFGILASKSNWFDFSAQKGYEIPGYFNLDTILSYNLNIVRLFLKVSNVFGRYFYTEPGFPMRDRFFEIGAGMKVF
jgi:outer membrane cobalamin receptor